MRLLVYTPTTEDGPAAACGLSIRGQQYSGKWKWVVDADDPFPIPDHRNVLAKYRRAQAMALAGGYDALVTVEHDMVLPVDALARLAGVAAGVVFGVYVLRHGSNVVNAWRYEGDRNLGMSLSLYPHELRRLREQGVAVRVSGVGWGCTLIRREVLAAAPLDDGGGECPAGDLPFAQWCLRAGVRMMAHFGVCCGHVEEGRVLEVGESIELVKCEGLQRVNVAIDGASVALVAGGLYALPAGDVAELERAGYVRRVVVERAVAEPEAETAVAPAGRKRKK